MLNEVKHLSGNAAGAEGFLTYVRNDNTTDQSAF
jgi:hypothetical protein